MSNSLPTSAIAQLEAAIARLETGVDRLDAKVCRDTRVAAQQERLRTEVVAVVAELDSLIAGAAVPRGGTHG